MHDHTRQRFRRYTHERSLDTDINRQHQLRKKAKQRLALLRRANEGYTKSLEQVLRLSYGRTGKRRRELLARFITPDVPANNTDEVAALVHRPSMLDDSWVAPQVVMDLLKSQQRNPVIYELAVRTQVKTVEPPIAKENAWGRPLSLRRRQNIRQRWYSAVLSSLFPPLPGEEMRILQGLISGSVPWTPPQRRRQRGDAAGLVASEQQPRARLSPEFLVEGPAKGHTFRQYVDGRPHNITRRFMRRLWQRLVCLVPQISWNDASHKYNIDWEPVKPLPPLALAMGADQAADIFANVNTRGELLAPPTKSKKSYGLG